MEISQIASLITALRAETEKGAITPDSLGYVLKLMCDFMESLQPTVLPDDVSIALANLQSTLEAEIAANEKSIMTAQREVSSLRTQHNSDLQTKMDSDVWNFSGFVEVTSADIVAGSAPETAGVLFNRTTNAFVFRPFGVTEASYYNNKAGEWNGQSSPSPTRLYKDTSTETLYKWDGTTLTAFGDVVYAGYKNHATADEAQTQEGFLERLAKYIDNQGTRPSYFSEVSDDEYLNFGQLKQVVGGADSSFSKALFNGAWGAWYLATHHAFGTVLGAMNSGLATTLASNTAFCSQIAAQSAFISAAVGLGTAAAGTGDNYTTFIKRLLDNAHYNSFLAGNLASNTAFCTQIAAQSAFISAAVGLGTAAAGTGDNYTTFIKRLLDNAHYNSFLAGNLAANTAFGNALGGNANLVVALGKNPGFSSSLSDENIEILGSELAANSAFVAAMKAAMA